MNPDEFYKNIERRMGTEMTTIGDIEKSFSQHMGRITNAQNPAIGFVYEDMLGKINRIMKGETGNRWDGQNKMSDLEKAVKKYKEENNVG